MTFDPLGSLRTLDRHEVRYVLIGGMAGRTFTTRYGSLDILGTPAGTSGYDELKHAANLMQIADLKVWVASLDDLMAMKRAAGRAKDLDALEVLGALRDELEGRPER